MKFVPFVAIAALVAVGPTFAAEKHDDTHAHESLHGGVVVEVKDLDLELVAKPEVIQLHVRDHGNPVDVTNGSAKLTLLSGAEKQEVELKPAGDRLEARGRFRVGAGTKLIAVVALSGKPSTTARFNLK